MIQVLQSVYRSSPNPMKPLKPMNHESIYTSGTNSSGAPATGRLRGISVSQLPRNLFLFPRWQLLRRPHGPIELLDADLAAAVFVLGECGQSRHAAAWYELKNCLLVPLLRDLCIKSVY